MIRSSEFVETDTYILFGYYFCFFYRTFSLRLARWPVTLSISVFSHSLQACIWLAYSIRYDFFFHTLPTSSSAYFPYSFFYNIFGGIRLGMCTRNKLYQLLATSVPKRCICVVVFILGTINQSDFSVKYRIIDFFVVIYNYSQNGWFSIEFDISRGVYFFLVRRY